jgi:hypothetical protein
MKYAEVAQCRKYYVIEIKEDNIDDVLEFIDMFSSQVTPDFDSLDESKQVGWLYKRSSVNTLSLRIGSYVVVDTELNIQVLSRYQFTTQYKVVSEV